MRLLCVLAMGLLSLPSLSQEIPLSGQARISLLTFGPAQEEFYEAFGHSAIRVVDTVHGIDYAFNYGVFSFNQPNFYLNFTRGHLYYQLGVYSYPEFRDAYISANRSIHEQFLDLTPDQKQRVFNFLEWNSRPENQMYNYDYFYDNCSSRIRDVFANTLKGEIRFDGSYITTDYTIRQLTDLYLDGQPWGDLGIDIGLGSTIDIQATPWQYMFLPDYLESGFDHAFVDSKGITLPLVSWKNTVYQSVPVAPSHSLPHPWTVFGFLLVVSITLSVVDLRRNKISTWFDAILFFTPGFLGLFLLFLWFGTDHHACARNYNILWALPTHFIAAILLLKKSRPRWLSRYFLVTGLICAVLLLTWPVLPQLLNYFLIPFVTTLLVRSLLLFKLLRLAV